MNISMKEKQNHIHREQTCGFQGGGCWGEGWRGRLGVADVSFIYRVDKQQGPTVDHRELYSISYDKP